MIKLQWSKDPEKTRIFNESFQDEPHCYHYLKLSRETKDIAVDLRKINKNGYHEQLPLIYRNDVFHSAKFGLKFNNRSAE